MRWYTVFANDNDALIPELWAQESLMVLESNLLMAQLVYRDFENEISRFGDTVNCHKPGTFVSKRKVDGDTLVAQNAQATNTPVVLNQHHYVTFMIYDGEESKSFKDLVALYLTPAISAVAQAIDTMLLCEAYNFMAYYTGALGTDIGRTTLVNVREKMNVNKVPQQGRNFVMTPGMEAALLAADTSLLVTAEKVGDDGSALREGSLGRKFGLNLFMSQNAPSIAAGNTIVTGEVDNGSGYAAGTTTMTVNGLSAAIAAGTWFTVEGDMIPQQVQSTVGGATPTAITFSPGLGSAVIDNADLTIYTAGAVNFGSNYASGWSKEMVVNGFSVAPKVGQLMTYGTSAYRYGLLATPTTTGILPNRPIEEQFTHAGVIGIGPKGDYGLAFQRDAIALVSRPLAAPMAGGVRTYVANYNGLSVRVVIDYDSSLQGHRVTVDLLCGVKTLNTALGVIVYG